MCQGAILLLQNSHIVTTQNQPILLLFWTFTMVTHQTFTDYVSDLQSVNERLSQAMKDGDLPNSINFTELDGSWHVCGEAMLSGWELIASNNPSRFELKLPFKSGDITILGDLHHVISLESCSLFIQIDLHNLEKEISDKARSNHPIINEIDAINLIRIEDPSRILKPYLPHLSTSLSTFIQKSHRAIALSIQTIDNLNLHTNVKWLVSSFQSEKKANQTNNTAEKLASHPSNAHYFESNTSLSDLMPLSNFMAIGKSSGILIRTKWLMKSLILPALPNIISQSAQEDDLSISNNYCIETIRPITSYPIKIGSKIYSTSYHHFRMSPTDNGIILEASGTLASGSNAELSFSIYAQYTLENINNENTVTLVPADKPIIKGQKNTTWYNCLDFRSGAKAESIFNAMLDTVSNSIDRSFKSLNKHLAKHVSNSLTSI
ncbi:hypothetical protein [Marinomonas sp. 2405UD68-3]|uniref:hypothetical protein n=1 Tax=Marinomonas sp. 2405UD68-3 TaxID=3391835 RepID=UPI0039C9F769